jgi:NADH-quinone oxidoreductase subunit J
MMAIDILLLVALVLAAVVTVTTARLLRSVIALAVTSAVLAVLMFRVQAPLAGVFELSVCAGLIPAIFLSTIGLTQRLTPETLAVRKKEARRRFWFLPILLVLLGIVLSRVHVSLGPPLPPAPKTDVRTVLWYDRQLDLLAQVGILLGAAFGVVVLIKEAKRE